MRLRELRKLVELLVAGGNALVVEDLAEVVVPGAHNGLPTGWSLDPDYLPLGPIRCEAFRTYLVTLNAQAIGNDMDVDAPDSLSYTLYSVCEEEPDGVMTWGTSSFPVSAEWPTSAWQASGNMGGGLAGIFTPIGDTELYFLVGASNPVGDALPSEPVTVRNRRMVVLPV